MFNRIKSYFRKNAEKNKSNDPVEKTIKTTTKTIRKLTIILVGSLTPILVTLLLIITVVFGPILLAKQYIEDLKRDVAIFFDKVGNVLTLKGWCSDIDDSCEKKAEQKYYETLNVVYNYYDKKNVEIDTELITGTIFYGRTLSDDQFKDDDEDEDFIDKVKTLVDDERIHLSDTAVLASNMVDGNKLDYTKYRKYLIDTYIPKRFEDMYETDEEKERIADDIMQYASLKDGKGSGQFASCNVINTSCTGITISNGTYAGTYTLEEYVAGVIAHEVGIGWPDEALKAQAIAARTYALNYTNSCTKPIENSTGAQTFEPTTNERLISAANDTAGMVLTYDDNIFASEYGAWWGNNAGSSCGTYKNCQNGECSIDLYKAPSGEAWTFTMPQNYFNYGQVTESAVMSDGTIQSLGGHCRGMTQFGSKYLALAKDFSYDQILETFYSNGVELGTFGNSTNSCPQGTTSQGLIASNYKGFMQRVSNPTASDYYYGQEYMYSSNIGQCVWYVQRRGIEIINTIDVDEEIRKKAETSLRNTTGNGRDWWNNPSLQMFGTSTNYEEPKVGAIIVWRYTESNIKAMGADYGHVAVVEAVDYENRTVTVSDGWKNRQYWGDGYNSIEYASFGFRTVPFEWVLNYGNPSNYIFMGYVYLLD